MIVLGKRCSLESVIICVTLKETDFSIRKKEHTHEVLKKESNIKKNSMPYNTATRRCQDFIAAFQ